MRFYCLSDNHGDGPQGRQKSLNGEIILHAGDYYDKGNPKVNRSWEEDVFPNNDLLIVRGNHDCVESELLEKHDLTMGLSRAGDLWIVGLGWCYHRYDRLPPEALMSQVVLRLLTACSQVMGDGEPSILLTHYAPHNQFLRNKEGWTFHSVSKLCEALRPVAIVSGHLHSAHGRTLNHDGSLLVFPGPKGGFLEIDEDFNAKWEGA